MGNTQQGSPKVDDVPDIQGVKERNFDFDYDKEKEEYHKRNPRNLAEDLIGVAPQETLPFQPIHLITGNDYGITFWEEDNIKKAQKELFYRKYKRVVEIATENAKPTFVIAALSSAVFYPLSRARYILFAERQLQYAGKREGFYKGNMDLIQSLFKTQGFGGMYRGVFLNSMRYGLMFALWRRIRDEGLHYSDYPDPDTSAPIYVGISTALHYMVFFTPLDYVRAKIMTDLKDPVTKQYTYPSYLSVLRQKYSNCDPVATFFSHFRPYYITFLHTCWYRAIYFGFSDIYLIDELKRSKLNFMNIFFYCWAVTLAAQTVLLPLEFIRVTAFLFPGQDSMKFRPVKWGPVLKGVILREHARGIYSVGRYFRAGPITAIPGAFTLACAHYFFREHERYAEIIKTNFIPHNWSLPNFQNIAIPMLFGKALVRTTDFLNSITNWFPSVPVPKLHQYDRYRKVKENEALVNLEEFKENERTKFVEYLTKKYPNLDEVSIKELVRQYDQKE